VDRNCLAAESGIATMMVFFEEKNPLTAKKALVESCYSGRNRTWVSMLLVKSLNHLPFITLLVSLFLSD